MTETGTLSNPELELARDYVRFTGCNIFLTGRAGTGKTTFLHTLQEETDKRMIITAPTGVAAINAGGVTLHSFFQLPFGPYVPGSESFEQNRQRQFRFSKEKKRIIRSLDLLVIDEISMVRADLLDAVDATLRRHRASDLPFGGVQLLMIGDLHQLPPVAKAEEWELLRHTYDSVFFFSSQALARTELVTIELQHIFRQSDPAFIRILNQVRDNTLDEAGAAELNRRYQPDFDPDGLEGCITLTTHNRSAESINRRRLQALAGKEYRFKAHVSGEFPGQLYPGPEALALKKGAQVMFLRNDPVENRFYNGRIGTVTRVSGSSIRVRCPGDRDDIVVEPVSWENIRYRLNEENGEIEEKVIGEFEQYPLKLAWAITIHKSQGLTFEQAVIDAGQAFAAGQVYVALSRCKSLEGLVLTTPISPQGFVVDPAVEAFDRWARANPPSVDRLQQARITYQQELLLRCFDLTLLRKRFGYLVYLLTANNRVVHTGGGTDFRSLEQQAVQDVFTVSENFRNQLRSLFAPDVLPGEDAHINERLDKAAAWFGEKITTLLEHPLEGLQVETDNTELRNKIRRTLDNTRRELGKRQAGIQACAGGFSPSRYLRAVTAAENGFEPARTKKAKPAAWSEQDITHPELFQTLRDWRSHKAGELGVAHYQVLHQRILVEITMRLPATSRELGRIHGVGPRTLERFGEEILELVNDYRSRYKITGTVEPDPPPREEEQEEVPAPSSPEITLELFRRGRDVAEIAEERGLALSTIETHLIGCIGRGQVSLERLVDGEKQARIEEALDALKSKGLKAVKESLGEEVSYNEIRMVLALRRSHEETAGTK